MADDAASFVRLHITPLDAELIKSVIPAQLLPAARNISYHTICTFPEKRYGFVELPAAEIEKIKKKFHGVTFKGCKMRIEKARAEERIRPDEGEDEEEDNKKRKKEKKENKREKKREEGEDGEEDEKKDKALGKTKKRKREVDVLKGVALQDRKVKRGWTEVPSEQKKRKRSKKDEDKDKDKDGKKDEKKQKKKRPQSKYTEGEECLLKVKVPASAMKNVSPADLPAAKKRKKQGGARQITVHEFEKTTKFPGFLRQDAGAERQRAVEFVEGKGWVDERGDVVEVVKQKEERERPKAKGKVAQKIVEEEEEEEEESSGTSSDDTSEEESDSDEEAQAPQTTSTSIVDAEKASDSESDTSSSTSDDEPDRTATETHKEKTKKDESHPAPKTLAIHIPSPEVLSRPASKAPALHPLEALYKRPAPAPSSATSKPHPTSEPFSFFGADNNDHNDDLEDEAADAVPDMPMTPFTRQDYEWRRVRSAAPTPDTTQPPRLSHLASHSLTPTPRGEWAEEEDEEEEKEEEEEEQLEDMEGEDGQEARSVDATSDFQKWFWENRRELNRSWMGRRKMAAKERRHRDNKARASRAV